MPGPISVHGIPPQPSWPDQGRGQQGKRPAREQKPSPKPDQQPEPIEDETTGPEQHDPPMEKDDYLGTRIDIEV